MMEEKTVIRRNERFAQISLFRRENEEEPEQWLFSIEFYPQRTWVEIHFSTLTGGDEIGIVGEAGAAIRLINSYLASIGEEDMPEGYVLTAYNEAIKEREAKRASRQFAREIIDPLEERMWALNCAKALRCRRPLYEADDDQIRLTERLVEMALRRHHQHFNWNCW